MKTTLYYAYMRQGGMAGICFQIGKSTLFFSTETTHVGLIDPTNLVMSGKVPPEEAERLSVSFIEPRLMLLAGHPQMKEWV